MILEIALGAAVAIACGVIAVFVDGLRKMDWRL